MNTLSKSLFSITTAILLGTAQGMAVPAYPGIVKVTEPDGTELSIRIHGDEYHNYLTTDDGYTVIDTGNGHCYAVASADGSLRSSGIQAHEPDMRNAGERSLLSGIHGTLIPQVTEASVSEMNRENARRMQRSTVRRIGNYDYSRFRGLVVLVEFNDRSFLRQDSKVFFDNMINAEGYTGYMTTGDNPEKIECTGSVRDYFRDNSGGLFNPVFDIYGPVKVNRSVYDVNKYVNAGAIGVEALQAIDAEVDFSRYDTDGDGVVDMVFFLYAGAGSNTGNDQRLLWPHASSLDTMGLTLDGVGFGSYACSTELSGIESLGRHDGIGTICHEFSHVLGLFDVYDTDYEGSGGQSVHPGRWSVMASGSYLNNSRTPCGYSLFEREWAGFTVPEKISGPGRISVEPLEDSNMGFRIETRQEGEYFLIENRQQTGWDRYLPGHGMLVFRVDLTDPDVWDRNVVNNNPRHNYYELLRAEAMTDINTGAVADTSYDPFPGSGVVTSISNTTTPSLRTWSGLMSDFSISDISEDDGVISFQTEYQPIVSEVEDCENMTMVSGTDDVFSGVFCDWTFTDVSLADSGRTGMAMAFVNRAYAATSLIEEPVQTMTFQIYNPTDENAKMRLYIKRNGTGNWIALKDYNLNRDVVAEAGKTTSVHYDIEEEGAAMFRLMQSAGSGDSPVYVDNIAIERKATASDPSTGVRTVDVDSGTLGVYVQDRMIYVSGDCRGPVSVYRTSGALVGTRDKVDGEILFNASEPGVYILTAGGRTLKLMVR